MSFHKPTKKRQPIRWFNSVDADANPENLRFSVRYGDREVYRKMIERAHASTNHRCCNCFRRMHPWDGRHKYREEFHHLHYWSLLRWLVDAFNALRGKPPFQDKKDEEDPHRIWTWGSIVNREWIGWTGVSLCWMCHDHAHTKPLWKIKPKYRDRLWGNRSEFWFAMKLRFNWFLLHQRAKFIKPKKKK